MPSRLTVQCGPNPTPHFGLIVSGGDEDRSESRIVDLIVVRPAARTRMIPVAAERDGHRGTDRGRIRSFAEDDNCLVDISLRLHSSSGHSIIRLSEGARAPLPRRIESALVVLKISAELHGSAI
jgi:hypothetical protein